MKTNLNSHYETKKELELEGSWYKSLAGSSFKIKRMGGRNQKKVDESRSKHFMSVIDQIQKNELPEDDQEKLFIKVFVESVLVDWKDVFDADGKDVEYDAELAEIVFFDCPDLFDELIAFANSRDNFKEKVALGNS